MSEKEKKQKIGKQKKEVFTKEDFLNALKKTTAPVKEKKDKEKSKTKNDYGGT